MTVFCYGITFPEQQYPQKLFAYILPSGLWGVGAVVGRVVGVVLIVCNGVVIVVTGIPGGVDG